MRKLILTLLFCLIASVASADHYYLARWEWVWHYDMYAWIAPHAEYRTGNLDFRSTPQRGVAEIPQGYGLFAYDRYINDSKMIYLGDDLDTLISSVLKEKLKKELVVTKIEESTLRNIIFELMTLRADPKGQDRWFPVRTDFNKKIKIYFTGKLLKEKKIIPGVSPEWDVTVSTIQEIYRRKVVDTTPINQIILAKQLDLWSEKYGVPSGDFIPEGVEAISPLPHETEIQEDWNSPCSAGDDPDCDVDWVEAQGDCDLISGEQANVGTTGTTALCYANVSLSSDGHYAQGISTRLDNGGNNTALMTVFIRYSDTTHHIRCDIWDGSPENWRFIVMDGTPSIEASGTFTWSQYDELKCTATEGDVMTHTIEDVDKHSDTYVFHQGDVLTGIGGYRTTASDYTQFDDFYATELGAPAGRTRRMF